MPTERQRAAEVMARKQRLEDLVAMGLAEYAKWDVVVEREKVTGTALSDADLNRVSDAFTARQWDEMQEDARSLLATFARNDTRWLVPIIQGVASAFIYSVLLVIVLLIIKANDIDILHALGIAQSIPAPHTASMKPEGDSLR